MLRAWVVKAKCNQKNEISLFTMSFRHMCPDVCSGSLLHRLRVSPQSLPLLLSLPSPSHNGRHPLTFLLCQLKSLLNHHGWPSQMCRFRSRKQRLWHTGNSWVCLSKRLHQISCRIAPQMMKSKRATDSFHLIESCVDGSWTNVPCEIRCITSVVQGV